jgi:hypothetical protein
MKWIKVIQITKVTTVRRNCSIKKEAFIVLLEIINNKKNSNLKTFFNLQKDQELQMKSLNRKIK